MNEQTDWAWAAGFFDGEGHTGSQRKLVFLSIDQNDREVLDKFLSSVGVGKVYGPYKAKGTNTRYEYRCGGIGVVIALGKMWPWLGSKKRAQALTVLEVFELPFKSSRFRGVSRSSKNTWRAMIRVSGVSYHLGQFLTEEEAASAYDKAAKPHGRSLNFPNMGYN